MNENLEEMWRAVADTGTMQREPEIEWEEEEMEVEESVVLEGTVANTATMQRESESEWEEVEMVEEIVELEGTVAPTAARSFESSSHMRLDKIPRSTTGISSPVNKDILSSSLSTKSIVESPCYSPSMHPTSPALFEQPLLRTSSQHSHPTSPPQQKEQLSPYPQLHPSRMVLVVADGPYIDWPPRQDLKDEFPDLYEDFMTVLPFKDYTGGNGVLNLACRLPDTFVPPDLGPKIAGRAANDFDEKALPLPPRTQRRRGEFRRHGGTGVSEEGEDSTGEGTGVSEEGDDRTGEGTRVSEEGEDRTGEGTGVSEEGDDRTGEGTRVSEEGEDRTGEGTGEEGPEGENRSGEEEREGRSGW
ncbi:hypothetical protein BC936DRAFT_147698 [Jimgerdemannia flammicorona]|uniref:Uncharacterized protein n=1 Tax=Jimgerdemannia flammicorona TaxID=994334 RepID=A0A433D4P5_9FUNG|nr:hypothetical protein BC936DRAFT_147698 [Jimgerdemannia flammicorona]